VGHHLARIDAHWRYCHSYLTIYTPIDIEYMANDGGAETIFCLDTNFGYVTQVLPETKLKRVIVTNLAELLPWWKWLIGRGFNKIPVGKFNPGEYLSF